jgi:hypothetical protein
MMKLYRAAFMNLCAATFLFLVQIRFCACNGRTAGHSYCAFGLWFSRKERTKIQQDWIQENGFGTETDIGFSAVPDLKRLVAGFPPQRPMFASGQHVGFVVDKLVLG